MTHPSQPTSPYSIQLRLYSWHTSKLITCRLFSQSYFIHPSHCTQYCPLLSLLFCICCPFRFHRSSHATSYTYCTYTLHISQYQSSPNLLHFRHFNMFLNAFKPDAETYIKFNIFFHWYLPLNITSAYIQM